MKSLLLLFCLFSASCLSGQPTDASWYKMWQGKVGNYPVTLHVHKFGNRYAGYYYYNSRQQPLSFSGTDTIQKGWITLSVNVPGSDEVEVFSFTITGNHASGSWRRNEKSKPMLFSAAEANQVIPLQYVFEQESVVMKPGEAESPAAHFEAGGVWTDAGGQAAVSLRKKVAGFFSEQPFSGNLGALLQQQKQVFFADYRKEIAAAKETELKETPAMFTRDETLRALVAHQDAALITLSLFSYAYTGGAHGNYGTGFTTIAFATGKPLQLADVITPAGQKALPQLLATAFRKQYGLKPTAKLTEGGLFDNTIKPAENFFVTGKGLGFNYVPYEIGPYAMGEILLFLPFTDLKTWIQPSFQKMLQKNKN